MYNSDEMNEVKGATPSNGKAPYPKKGKRFKKKWRKGKTTSSSGKPNDIKWYSGNPILMKLAGLVNFLYKLGSKIRLFNAGNWQDKEDAGTAWQYAFRTIAGIMRLTWIPTPGVSNSPESPVNKVASKLYQVLRLKNFSVSVYDSVDVIFYLLAADSLCAFYAYLTLVYAHAKEYKFTNAYYPKAILEALNVNPDDITDNLDNLLFYINVMQKRLSTLRIPKQFWYTARHMHMSAQVYKDASVEKSQLYLFVPGFLLKYDATVPKLTPVNIGFEATPMTFATLQSKFDSMTNAVLPDDDFSIIAADIEKFFGSDYWTLNELDWNAQLEPVYNEEMLWQIHNANFLPYSSVSGLDITQVIDTNLNTILQWDPVFTSPEHGVSLNRVLTSDVDSPDASEVVESTRLMFTIRDYSETTTSCTFKLESCGSEIICNATIFQYNNEGYLKSKPYTQFIRCNTDNHKIVFDHSGDEDFALGSDLYSLINSHVFDYAPIGYIVIQRVYANKPENLFLGFAGQITNYAILENQQLEALHEQSLLSEFNLTASGR